MLRAALTTIYAQFSDSPNVGGATLDRKLRRLSCGRVHSKHDQRELQHPVAVRHFEAEFVAKPDDLGAAVDILGSELDRLMPRFAKVRQFVPLIIGIVDRTCEIEEIPRHPGATPRSTLWSKKIRLKGHGRRHRSSVCFPPIADVGCLPLIAWHGSEGFLVGRRRC